MTVQAVLWDADGVLQGLPAGWEASMRPAVGHLVDAAQSRPKDPELDAYDDALQVWLTIEPVLESRHLVEQVRASGVRCYLATNQDVRRGTYMHENLGYADLLDGAFYSYELGLAKPDPAYFTEIARRLELPEDEVLLVDDNADNVAGAREAGLRAERWHHDDGIAALDAHLRRHDLSVG